MQQVVHLSGITQCAVLPDFSFLLVVANKVLVACEFDFTRILSLAADLLSSIVTRCSRGVDPNKDCE